MAYKRKGKSKKGNSKKSITRIRKSGNREKFVGGTRK